MNKGMKWSAALLSAGIVLGGSVLTGEVSVSAASTDNQVINKNVQQANVALKYNGKTLTQQGRAIDGNTMIPLTFLRDALGLPLSYTPSTKTSTVDIGSKKLNMETSEYGVYTNLNGYYIYSYTNKYEVKNVDGHLYVPFKLLSDYLGFQGVYNPSLKSLDISKRVLNDISISTETLNKSNKNADIQIQYPQISGLTDEAQQAINTVFKQKAEAFATASEKQASQRDGSVERKYDFSQNFIVSFNREGVLSIVVDQDSYIGGAHGSTIREGLTFSLNTGNQMQLGDLMKAAPNYKQNLDKMLKERTKEVSFADVSPGLNAKPDFYVKEGGIAILYQQYEIAPYAAGLPTFEFNFSDLLPKGTDPFTSFK